jgi:hypothetical protein
MRKQVLAVTAMAVLVGSTAHAQQLSGEQAGQLLEVGQEFSQQAIIFEGLMKNKLTELAIELQREGRLDTEASAAEASEKVNTLLTDLGQLYGEYIKVKVQYILKAKNVLTNEQKLYLLSQLAPNDSLPYETITYLQPEVFDLPLNLSVEQEKQLVEIEAALLLKEVGIERDVELTLLDLRELLWSGQPQPEKVDPLVMKLADLAAQTIDNRVNFFLQSKDVLTLDQKRLLANMLGLD